MRPGRGGQASQGENPPLPEERDGAEKPGLRYHYSRQERLNLPGAPAPRPTGGFLKRNRSLTILLLDLLIILILGFVVFHFLGGPTSSGRIRPYAITLRALRDRDTVLATVTVRLSAGRQASSTEARIYVLLSLAPGGGEEQPLSALLPSSPEGETVLRAVLPYREKPTAVNAEARIGDRTVQLRRSLD